MENDKIERQNQPLDVPSLILSSFANADDNVSTESPLKEINATTEVYAADNTIDIYSNNDKLNSLVLMTPETIAKSTENKTVSNSLDYSKIADNISSSVLKTSQPNVNIESIATTTLPSSSISSISQAPDQGTQLSSTSPSIAEIVLEKIESISKSPETDNYIYETFSPISPVNIDRVSSIQQNDHLVIAEEPPESISIDSVPAA